MSHFDIFVGLVIFYLVCRYTPLMRLIGWAGTLTTVITAMFFRSMW